MARGVRIGKGTSLRENEVIAQHTTEPLPAGTPILDKSDYRKVVEHKDEPSGSGTHHSVSPITTIIPDNVNPAAGGSNLALEFVNRTKDEAENTLNNTGNDIEISFPMARGVRIGKGTSLRENEVIAQHTTEPLPTGTPILDKSDYRKVVEHEDEPVTTTKWKAQMAKDKAADKRVVPVPITLFHLSQPSFRTMLIPQLVEAILHWNLLTIRRMNQKTPLTTQRMILRLIHLILLHPPVSLEKSNKNVISLKNVNNLPVNVSPVIVIGKMGQSGLD
nr:hypothetical protein [Tanacetum cinerariifolium]